MIDYERLKLQTLTDKHILQHANYLELDGDDLIIEMYKKGYQDCVDNIRVELK